VRPGIAAALRAFDDGRDRAEFYRNWRAGVAAGLTHPNILGLRGESRGTTRAVRLHLLEGTTAGKGVAALVRSRPALFEPFEAALLMLGDESGQLEAVLVALGEFFWRQYKMMLVVKRQLAYPMFVGLIATFIAPLPLLFMDQARAYVATVVLGLLAWAFLGGSVIAGRAQAYQRKPAFVRARLARALATAIEAGLPLGRATTLAVRAAGSPALEAHVRQFNEKALTSQPLSRTLEGAPGLTPEFHASLSVAERTGDYTGTLRKLAELYEDGFK
jgi:type II secretory pathway component PulF